MAAPLGDLSVFFCWNPDCPDFRKRNTGRIGVQNRARRNPILICRRCGKTFSSSRGTVYFHSHKSKDDVDAILGHLSEGVGVRATGRLLGIGKDTVTRYARLGGQQARALHDEFVRDVEPGEVQMDEKWAFAKKNKAT